LAKSINREQAERKKLQAAEFMDRIGDPDRADDFDDMSVEEYAGHRGFRLTNPQRSTTMATSTGPTKADLQDQIDSAIEALEEAYTPESSREDLAEAVGGALDILRGDDEDDTDEDEDDDNSGDDVSD
jgi:hypothetical protein